MGVSLTIATTTAATITPCSLAPVSLDAKRWQNGTRGAHGYTTSPLPSPQQAFLARAVAVAESSREEKEGLDAGAVGRRRQAAAAAAAAAPITNL